MIKKITAFLLTALLIFVVSIPAFAASDAIAISSLDGLKAMEGSTGKFYLTKDITVSKNADALSPIKNFNGQFDGNGKKISGLTIKADEGDTEIGLFSSIKGSGTVKNLTLENVTVEVTTDADKIYFYIGTIAGINHGTVENCRVSGKVTVNAPKSTVYAGGIVGYNYKNIIYLENYSDINATAAAVYAGGITGRYVNGGAKSLKYCINNGNITVSGVRSDSYGGGIAGRSEYGIENCANYGSVYVSSDINAYAGGIVGDIIGDSGTITKCYNAGKINQKSGTESFWDAIVGDEECWSKAISCYYLSGSVQGKNNSDVETAKVLSADEASSIGAFGALDFSDIWGMNDGKLSIQAITAPMPKVNTSSDGGNSNTSSTTSGSGTQGTTGSSNVVSNESGTVSNESGTESENDYIPPINGSDSDDTNSAATPDDNFTPKKALPAWIFIIIAVLAAAGVCVFLYTYKKKN